jgi:hypothetical protein
MLKPHLQKQWVIPPDAKGEWQFTTADARIRLKCLSPAL